MNPKMIFHMIKTHGPAILTVLGCIGVPVTAILASKATVKTVDDCLNDEVLPLLRKEGPDDLLDPEFKIHIVVDLTEPECIKAVWKNYIPTLISGGLTIGAIIGSNRLSAKEIAMLSASCAGLMSYKAQVEQEIRKRYGEDALNDIRKSVDQKYAKVLIYPEDTGNGDLLCFDAFGGRWFYSSEDAVNMALFELNDEFMNETIQISNNGDVIRGGYRCYNDLYQKWGISETCFGWTWGWAPNSDYYDGPILWSVRKVEGFQELDEPVLIIEPLTYPMEGWMEV